MFAVKKSRNRRLAFSPASAISFSAHVADAAAGRTIVVGTMMASARLAPPSDRLSTRPPMAHCRRVDQPPCFLPHALPPDVMGH
jgi:hypothetical protein